MLGAPGAEEEEKNAVRRPRDRLEDFGHVCGSGGVLGLRPLLRVRREPDAGLAGGGRTEAELRWSDRIVRPQDGGLLGPVGDETVPVVEIARRDRVVVQHKDVVALSAEASRRPVGGAREDDPGDARGVDVDDELVVPDVGALGEEPVDERVAEHRLQLDARRCVRAVVDLHLLAGRAYLGGIGVREQDLHAPCVSFDRVDQLTVGQLVERAVARPALGARAVEQARQHADRLSREPVPDRVTRNADVLAQRRFARRPRRPARQGLAQRLRGDDAPVEDHAVPADPVGRLDAVRADGQPRYLDELLPGCARDGDDLVRDLGLLRDEEVLPLVRLDRPVVGGRTLHRRRLRGVEAHEGRQRPRRLPGLEAPDGEPEAVRRSSRGTSTTGRRGRCWRSPAPASSYRPPHGGVRRASERCRSDRRARLCTRPGSSAGSRNARRYPDAAPP